MSQDEIQSLKNKLKEKLKEYGSIELMANLAAKETFYQSPIFHNPSNPISEDPFVLFSLGLFLSNNNLKSGEPQPKQLEEFITLLTQYFQAFKLSLIKIDNKVHLPEDGIMFTSQLQKIIDDANPHMFPNQKIDYFKKVFSPLDDYFISKYGFTIKDAENFADQFLDRFEKHMENKHKFACEKYYEEKERLAKPENKSLLEKCAKNNVTIEQMLQFYTDALHFADSSISLVININNYCKEQKIDNVDIFRKYLNTFSCTFCDQFKEFNDLLSDNIILYKPIIKLDENTFFLPKPDFLHNKLDLLLEFLLEEEKQIHSNTWNRFAELKSGYLENKTYEFFSRVFPTKCLFQNVYYWIGNERKEVDLLIIYDNKIFIVESKSGNLPLSVKREGQGKLQTRLSDLVKKALQQATSARDYIKSQPKVQFWNKSKNKVLIQIDSTETNYDFFFVDVTLEHLGSFGTNLKNLNAFNFFEDNEYPWSVCIHDLDVVSDLLTEPIYFIHYLEQRLIAQDQNIISSVTELILLGHYLQYGNFHPENITDSTNPSHISIYPEFMNSIEEYYVLDKRKPQLAIPKKLEELLLNMQKYRQKGFTKITSLLLDFPLAYKNSMEKKFKRIFKQTNNNKSSNGFSIAVGKPFDIGFSYLTSFDMKNFYKYTVNQYKTRKQERNITRWATIGRNMLDKKNYATFFIYDDTPIAISDDSSQI